MQNTFKIDELREDISSNLAYILAPDDSDLPEEIQDLKTDTLQKSDISKFIKEENLNLDDVDIPEDFILNGIPKMIEQL